MAAPHPFCRIVEPLRPGDRHTQKRPTSRWVRCKEENSKSVCREPSGDALAAEALSVYLMSESPNCCDSLHFCGTQNGNRTSTAVLVAESPVPVSHGIGDVDALAKPL
jgi:hypothetical protein